MIHRKVLYRGAVYCRSATKMLYLMRGVSGAGKSTVARRLGSGGVVLSADDFFMDRGQYRYDRTKIAQAHEWNQRRAEEAMRRGISPIVIDNTLVKAWEGKPYVELGLQYGYQIKIAEPDNPLWRRFQPGMSEDELDALAHDFGKRNVHGVPPDVIKRSLLNWQHRLKVTDIMRSERPVLEPAQQPISKQGAIMGLPSTIKFNGHIYRLRTTGRSLRSADAGVFYFLKLYFGFALADSMFGGDCSISRKKLTPDQAIAYIEAAKQSGTLVPVLNPSHQATISAMESRYGIRVDIPQTAPRAQLQEGDQLVVMGVRGLPRLDATRHEYTEEEISKATFEFSIYTVGSCVA